MLTPRITRLGASVLVRSLIVPVLSLGRPRDVGFAGVVLLSKQMMRVTNVRGVVHAEVDAGLLIMMDLFLQQCLKGLTRCRIQRSAWLWHGSMIDRAWKWCGSVVAVLFQVMTFVGGIEQLYAMDVPVSV